MIGLREREALKRGRSGKTRGWGPCFASIAPFLESRAVDIIAIRSGSRRIRIPHSPGLIPTNSSHVTQLHQEPLRLKSLPCTILVTITILVGSVLPRGLQSQTFDVDVACAYSPTAALRAGGEENLQLQFSTALLAANTIFENSGTGVRFRISGFAKSALDPVDINSADLLDAISWYSGFNDIRTFAENTGADLLAYIAKTTGYSAVAELPGTYSVFSDQAIWYTVVAHELAHNFGATHQDGLQFKGTNGVQYTTIMLMNYCAGVTIPFFTSSNLQYMGVILLGNTASNCGMGNLVNGGQNARKIADSAQSIFAKRNRNLPAPPLANGLVYRWSFNCAFGTLPAGTIVLDSVSATPGIVRGQGAHATGKGLSLPGTTTGNTAGEAVSAYLDLPNGIISALTNLTIEIWTVPLAPRPGQRLFSFGRMADRGNASPGEWVATSDSPAPGPTTALEEIALCLSTNNDLSRLAFIAKRPNSVKMLNVYCPIEKQKLYHYVVTYEAGKGAWPTNGGRFTLYLNGNPIGYLDVDFRLQDIQDVNNWLGRAQDSANYNAAVEIEEFRIYNRALSADEVLSSWSTGPDTISPASPYTSGELIVDLRATDFNGTIWTNRTGYGDFLAVGSPILTLNVSNTGVPGIYFNGTSTAFIGPPSTPSIDGDQPRSIEVWVLNPALASEETLVSWGERKSPRYNMAFNCGNSTTCGAATHTGDDVSWGGTPPKPGVWQHLVYTYSNRIVRLYVNGVLRWQWKLAAPLNTSPGKPINVGCQRNTSGALSQFFSGFINSVRVHAGVLTPEQVAGNYLLGPSKFNTASQASINANPVINVKPGANIYIQPGYNLPPWITNAVSFTLLAAPPGVTIDPRSGLISWRPSIAQAGATHYIGVSATTTNGPYLSSTQWLALYVTPLQQPRITKISLTNGVATLTIEGELGLDYKIQASSNLTDWEDLMTLRPTTPQFSVQDHHAAYAPMRFYRVQICP